MGIGQKAQIRVERRQKLIELTRIEKDEEQYRTLEEVFDRTTLLVIYRLLNKDILKHLYGVVRAGKESRVYHAEGAKGENLAVKIYLTVSSEFRRGMLPYVQGDTRFKAVRRNSKSLVYVWAQKEFKNLEKALLAHVLVPKPIVVEKNVLVMEFIGKDGQPAPTLKEVTPRNPATMYKAILTAVKRLYCKAGLVHGDLSEYNIMNVGGRPVLIDMSQSVLLDHPRAEEFLERDLENVNRYFSRLDVNVRDLNSLFKWVTGHERKYS
ncbi:MAG: serine protein kinase RIO [Candidatus Bathyarchaeia archaeon]